MAFKGCDLANFWEDSDYARESYIEAPPSDEQIAAVEAELGYRLPAAYIALMRTQNGGIPVRTCFPTRKATSWAEDHVAIAGIMGIGREKDYSLCGSLGSRFMLEEWEYPAIGVCVCNCPSAGHDMIMLDYRACGPDGEPTVVHVDEESDYSVTLLAENFESFIRGLVHESIYDTSAQDLRDALAKVTTGQFSPLLASLVQSANTSDLAPALRQICHALTEEKGHFSLHGDERSQLVYDLLFSLYSSQREVRDVADYLRVYPELLVFGAEFSTGGYAPSFVQDWWEERRAQKQIVTTPGGLLRFDEEFEGALLRRVRTVAVG